MSLVTQSMLQESDRVSDYGTLKFPLYPDSHLSKEEKSLITYEEKEKHKQEQKIQTTVTYRYMSSMPCQTVY